MTKLPSGLTNDVEDVNQILSFKRHLLRHLRCPHSSSSSSSRFTASVPRCGRILGSLRALRLKPRSHQRINLTSIVLDAARISSKHKLMLPDLYDAVADVKARIMKLLTRPPFGAFTPNREMIMSTMNRRALVAAVLPAIAIPAAAQCVPDPVFAAIANHRLAAAAELRARHDRDAMDATRGTTAPAGS
jgi:hypothetical protein